MLTATALLLGTAVGRAAGAPGADDEGGTAALRTALDEASKGFLDAQAALEASKKRQADLTAELQATEARLETLRGGVNEIAQAAYRSGGLRTASAMLSSDSPDAFVDRATTLNLFAMRNDRQLRDLRQTREKITTGQRELDAEVGKQQQQVDSMAKAKAAAEAALRQAGGGATTAGHGSTKNAAAAVPAPRSSNGSLPSQGCSVNDPTTGGCITARTAHALEQAKAAGFTHFVSCHRSGGGGEHPKGRACDFAANASTFAGTASGADRTYGNNLAAYFIANARQLGVLYVIWFRQIWMPSSGWRSYSGGNGDPASDHTNHVHLSVV